MRESLIRDRTKTVKQMHGSPLEFGISLPIGMESSSGCCLPAEHALPACLVAILDRLHAHSKYLTEQIGEIDKDLAHGLAEDDLGRRLFSIPGARPIPASVLATDMGDGKLACPLMVQSSCTFSDLRLTYNRVA